MDIITPLAYKRVPRRQGVIAPDDLINGALEMMFMSFPDPVGMDLSEGFIRNIARQRMTRVLQQSHLIAWSSGTLYRFENIGDNPTGEFILIEPSDPAETSIVLDTIREFLEPLTPRDRAIIMLRAFGYYQREVAQLLSVTQGTVGHIWQHTGIRERYADF
jgi:RNA polymerase sigma factor (sigma-70 family)